MQETYQGRHTAGGPQTMSPEEISPITMPKKTRSLPG